MSKHHPYYDLPSVSRATVLTQDGDIKRLRAAYAQGVISHYEAAMALRSAGACEPEIRECLA